jgi:hypothetical protein
MELFFMKFLHIAYLKMSGILTFSRHKQTTSLLSLSKSQLREHFQLKHCLFLRQVGIALLAFPLTLQGVECLNLTPCLAPFLCCPLMVANRIKAPQ